MALPKGKPRQLDIELRRCCECPPAGELVKRADALLQGDMTCTASDGRATSIDTLKLLAADRPVIADTSQNNETAAPLPMPKGLTYPVLQPPRAVAAADSHASELARMEELFSAPDLGVLTRQLRETSTELAESWKQVEAQHASLPQECKAQYAQMLEATAVLSSKCYEADTKAKEVQLETVQQLSRAAEELLQRQQASHHDDICRLKDELEIRQQQRAKDVAQILKTQDVMDLEQQEMRELADKLQESRMKAENEHVQKLADLGRIECGVLGDLRKQQIETYDECAEVSLQADVELKSESARIRASAQMRRKAEVDLSLQGVFKELELGRHVAQGTLGRIRTMAETFQEDAIQVQDERQKLADTLDARAQEEEEVRWARDEFDESVRRLRAREQAENEERVIRRSAEEEALLSEVRQHVASELNNVASQDAAAAEEAEADLRRALYGLDDIRRAREDDREQLQWE